MYMTIKMFLIEKNILDQGDKWAVWEDIKDGPRLVTCEISGLCMTPYEMFSQYNLSHQFSVNAIHMGSFDSCEKMMRGLRENNTYQTVT